MGQMANAPSADETKMTIVREIFEWYDKQLGVKTEPPAMEDTKWNLWGGVYYAASLYTTIGKLKQYLLTNANPTLNFVGAKGKKWKDFTL